MMKFHNTIKINASPDKVWRVVGDPVSVTSWIPGIAAAKMDGDKRFCTTADGGELHEDIYNRSDKNRSYSYTVYKMPFPAKEVRGTISVKDDKGGSLVTWDAEIDPLEQKQEAELTPMFDGIYKQALETLRKQFEGVK